MTVHLRKYLIFFIFIALSAGSLLAIGEEIIVRPPTQSVDDDNTSCFSPLRTQMCKPFKRLAQSLQERLKKKTKAMFAISPQQRALAAESILEEFVAAAESGNSTLVQELMKRSSLKVNESSKQQMGSTALEAAARMGQVNVVKILLDNRLINVNARSNNGHTPLTSAAYHHQIETVQLLLEVEGIMINTRGAYRQSALETAALHGDLELTNALIAGGANVNYSEYENSALIAAIQCKKTDVVKALLKVRGIAVNKANARQETPLMVACEQASVEIVRLLLAFPEIMVNAKDENGLTALTKVMGMKKGECYYYSSWSQEEIANRREILRMLLAIPEVEADTVIFTNNEHITPLIFAVKNHAFFVEDLVTSLCIGINWARHYGGTALMFAAEKGNEAMVALLLKAHDIQVNAQDSEGETALIKAAKNGKIGTIRLLLGAPHINVNIAGRCYGTALAQAACKGHVNIVHLLLKHDGIKLHTADSYGRYIPLSDVKIEVARLLLGAGEVNMRHEFSRAVHEGKTEFARLLLEGSVADLHVNAENEDGNTLFISAAAQGHSEMIRLLLSVPEVDIYHQNKAKKTAIEVAEEKGQLEVVRLLQEHANLLVKSAAKQ